MQVGLARVLSYQSGGSFRGTSTEFRDGESTRISNFVLESFRAVECYPSRFLLDIDRQLHPLIICNK